MENKAVINIVGTRCPTEHEERFDRWYSEKHLPDLLRFKGIRKATRYKVLSSTSEAAAKDYPTFVTIYEFADMNGLRAYEASPELAAAREDAASILKETKTEVLWRVQCEVIESYRQ